MRRMRLLRLLGVAGALAVVLGAVAFQRWNDSPIADGDFLVKVPPMYPQAAVDADIQGRVVVAVTIGTDGRLLASSIRSTSGSTMLDDAALEAARRSTYRTPTIHGIAIRRSFSVFYTFALDR